MQLKLTIFLLLFLMPYCYSQSSQKLQLIIDTINAAKNDEEKIAGLGKLADYYYVFKLDRLADSTLQVQLDIAEASQNKNLILATLFSKSVNAIGSWTKNETFDRLLAFMDKGLNYARETRQNDYIALAHIRKAGLYRKRLEIDLAIQQTTHAFSAIGTEKMDSIRAVLHLELGEIYQAKGEILNAYRNYNAAFASAYNLKNVPLQSEVFHRFAWLYQSIKDVEQAKSNLSKSLAINTANNNRQGVLYDYIDLARITNKKEFIDKSISLADSLQLLRELIFSKRLLFSYYMVIDKNSTMALQFLKNNQDLHQYYINQGPADYNWNIGNIYKYAGKPDSALNYYEQAKPEMQKQFAAGTQRILYKEIGDCYALLNQNVNAITNYELALKLSEETKDLSFSTDLIEKLHPLYASSGNDEKAYMAMKQYVKNKDSLEGLAAQRGLILLDLEREAQSLQKDMDEEAAKKLRIKNLQYWAIGTLIAFVFFALLIAGMFPISKFAINLFSFFSFICLFEFIVLLIDTEFLHSITHGEPLKLWLIKIFLIALLVPCQHFLEHGLTRFVSSRRLMKLRQNLSIKKWWQGIKKPSMHKVDSFEDDTAIL